jgi:putative PIN family toxin of toxin-antitoxin system
VKVVLDTNVWVSAYLNPRGVPGRIVDTLSSGRIEAVSTKHLWTELRRVIYEPKVREMLEARNLWDDARLLVAMQLRVELIENESPHENRLADDPDDDWVIQCALSANADYIVTGDKALLGLGRIGNVLIVSPSNFVTKVLEVLDK